ncbi:hypothetical protein CR513_48818, partial [Mucuna pruriens]
MSVGHTSRPSGQSAMPTLIPGRVPWPDGRLSSYAWLFTSLLNAPAPHLLSCATVNHCPVFSLSIHGASLMGLLVLPTQVTWWPATPLHKGMSLNALLLRQQKRSSPSKSRSARRRRVIPREDCPHGLTLLGIKLLFIDFERAMLWVLNIAPT